MGQEEQEELWYDLCYVIYKKGLRKQQGSVIVDEDEIALFEGEPGPWEVRVVLEWFDQCSASGQVLQTDNATVNYIIRRIPILLLVDAREKLIEVKNRARAEAHLTMMKERAQNIIAEIDSAASSTKTNYKEDYIAPLRSFLWIIGPEDPFYISLVRGIHAWASKQRGEQSMSIALRIDIAAFSERPQSVKPLFAWLNSVSYVRRRKTDLEDGSNSEDGVFVLLREHISDDALHRFEKMCARHLCNHINSALTRKILFTCTERDVGRVVSVPKDLYGEAEPARTNQHGLEDDVLTMIMNKMYYCPIL